MDEFGIKRSGNEPDLTPYAQKTEWIQFGTVFCNQSCPWVPQKIPKKLSIDLAEKIVTVVVVNFLPYTGNFMQSFFTLQVRFLEL